MDKFEKLGINTAILKALQEDNIDTPTEIQEKAIPLVIEGKDVIGGSSQALILTPTRELAEQIKKSLIKFSKHAPLHITSVYGGVSIQPQMKALRTADVVVATPGRMLDHMQQGTIKLSKVKTLVLDEADRMLEMGFIDDVEQIIRACPKERQTLLFSATITKDITRLSHKYMNNPEQISAKSHVDPTKLTQVYYNVDDKVKFSALVHFLKEEKGVVMVFCNTKRNVDFIANNLNGQKIEAHAIHGGFTQSKRSKVLEHFHKGKVDVLICTDVAARGLDIPGVTHVYNYDIPREANQYIHRIGRTARAGSEGKAISLLSQRDFENFDRVVRETKLNIKKEELPKLERVDITWKERPGRGNSRDSGRGGYGGGRGRSSGGRGGYGGGRGNGRSSGGYGGGRGRSSGGRDSGRRSGPGRDGAAMFEDK